MSEVPLWWQVGGVTDAVSKDSFVLDANTLAWSRLEVSCLLLYYPQA